MTCFSPEFLLEIAKKYHWDDLERQLQTKPYSTFNPLELEDIWREMAKRLILMDVEGVAFDKKSYQGPTLSVPPHNEICGSSQ